MSLSTFPPELLGLILEDTPLSRLEDVALVCRSFYSICRPKLPLYRNARNTIRDLELTDEDTFEGSILNVLEHLAKDPAQCKWIETADLLRIRDWSFFELSQDDNPVQQILETLQRYILEQSPAFANTTLITFNAEDFQSCEEEEHRNVLVLMLLSLLPNAKAIRLPWVLDDLVDPLRNLPSQIGRIKGARPDYLDFLIEQANIAYDNGHQASLSKIRNLELTRMPIEDRNIFISMRGLTRFSLTHFAAYGQVIPCYQNITTAHLGMGTLADRRIEEFFEQARSLRHLSICHRPEYYVSEKDDDEDVLDCDDCIWTAQSLAKCIEDKLSNTLETLIFAGGARFDLYWHCDPDFPEIGPKPQLSFSKLTRLKQLVLGDAVIAAFALPMITFKETRMRAIAVQISHMPDGHVYTPNEVPSRSLINAEQRESLLRILFPTTLVQLGISGEGGFDFSLTLDNLFTDFQLHKHILPHLEKVTLAYGQSIEEQGQYVQPQTDIKRVLMEVGVELDTQVHDHFNSDGRLRDRVQS